MRTRVARYTFGLTIVLASSRLSAHHSYSSVYFEDAPPMKIEGTVAGFFLRNPHSYLRVDCVDPKTGGVVQWTAEWSAPGPLAQQGVRRDSLKKGDKVQVVGSPPRDAGEHRIRMRSVTRISDGWNWGNLGHTFR